MNSDLRLVLDEVNDASDSNSYTHVDLRDTSNKWTIKPQKLNIFWTNYCDLSYSNSGATTDISLAERQT